MLSKEREIHALGELLEPSEREARIWLRSIDKHLSNAEIGAFCSVAPGNVSAWRNGQRGIRPSNRRLIWLLWSIFTRPDNLQDVFTMLTWGRFTAKGARDEGWKRGRDRGKPRPMPEQLRRKRESKCPETG